MDPQPFVVIGAEYSRTFAYFPEYNSIPHGRDFFLLTLIATLAYFDGVHVVCSGSEFELYSKMILCRDTMIYRHDSQSAKGYHLLTEYLQRWYSPHFIACSPVSPLSEFRSFKILFEKAPKAFRHLTSCFWGHWCGVCLKCFRYSLIQETLGNTLLQFKTSPLVDSPFLRSYIENWADKSLSYWQEIHYCLSILTQRDDFISRSDILQKYKTCVLPCIEPALRDIYHSYLMKTHKVELLPQNFDATLLG
jgi:hypothetical protein